MRNDEELRAVCLGRQRPPLNTELWRRHASNPRRHWVETAFSEIKLGKIEMGADGQPVVTWDPALNGEGVRTGVRTYTVMGSNVLSNDPKDWTECGEGKEGGFRYFKVSVRMP